MNDEKQQYSEMPLQRKPPKAPSNLSRNTRQNNLPQSTTTRGLSTSSKGQKYNSTKKNGLSYFDQKQITPRSGLSRNRSAHLDITEDRVSTYSGRSGQVRHDLSTGHALTLDNRQMPPSSAVSAIKRRCDSVKSS